jgi:hypothetical protein
MPEKEQPIEDEFREKMNVLAHFLDEQFNGELKGEDRKVGFALFVFKFGHGEDHRSNYLSNANRETMLATLKEFIARAEGRHHEFNPMKKTQ